MILTFRPLKQRPPGWEHWPGRASPFAAPYSDTLQLLERELDHLNARTPLLQVEATPRGVRMDGQLRADARVTYPGVILSFRTPKFGTLSYPCNAFDAASWRRNSVGWQANLRAIALGLEALRKVERYGIADRGQQYAGWAELGTGIPLGPHRMTVEEAAKILNEGSGCPGIVNPTDIDPEAVKKAYKLAATEHHPDKGGSEDTFKRIVAARELLERS